MSRYSDIEDEIKKLQKEIKELWRVVRELDRRTVGEIRLK